MQEYYNTMCTLSPEIETVENPTDSDSQFDVYFRVTFCPDIVFQVYNSSSSFLITTYAYSNSGTITIGDRKYNKIGSTSISSVVSASKTLSLTLLKSDNIYCLVLNWDGSKVSISLMKTVEICTKKEVIMVYNLRGTTYGFDSTFFPSTAEGSSYVQNIRSMLNIYGNNGYIKLSPILFYGNGMMTTVKNPYDFCFAYDNSDLTSAMTFSVGSTVVIGGQHYFVFSTDRLIAINEPQ